MFSLRNVYLPTDGIVVMNVLLYSDLLWEEYNLPLDCVHVDAHAHTSQLTMCCECWGLCEFAFSCAREYPLKSVIGDGARLETALGIMHLRFSCYMCNPCHYLPQLGAVPKLSPPRVGCSPVVSSDIR